MKSRRVFQKIRTGLLSALVSAAMLYSAFAVGSVNTVSAAECHGWGQECQSICESGWGQLQAQCGPDGILVDFVECNACSYPGSIVGSCGNGAQVYGYCF